MPKTIRQEWASYRTEVIPADAGNIQLVESRRCFYAGAWAVLNLLMALGDDKVSEDTGALAIELWRRECLMFNEQVKKGVA